MKRMIKTLCLLPVMAFTQVQAQTGTLQVWAHDIDVHADGTTVTHLTFSENDTIDYAAFQMTLLVPKGIKVAQVRSGREMVNDISLNEYRTTSSHQIDCYQPNETSINIASMGASSFYHDDYEGNPVDELFTIGLIGEPTMMNKEYEISVVGCKFIQNDSVATASIPEVFTIKLTVTGGSQVNFTMTEIGYGTLILPFDAEIPAGLRAYKCTDVIDGVVQTEEQTGIEANVPLLMAGTPGEYVFTGDNTPIGEAFTEGVLTGVFVETTLTSGYILQPQNGVTCFYRVIPELPVTVPVNRCYLDKEQTFQVNFIDLNLIPTGINETKETEEGGRVYDLLGRPVENTVTPGIYIKGHKKIIVK